MRLLPAWMSLSNPHHVTAATTKLASLLHLRRPPAATVFLSTLAVVLRPGILFCLSRSHDRLSPAKAPPTRFWPQDLSIARPSVHEVAAELPLVPELASAAPDAAMWAPGDGFRDVPLSFATVLENILDVAHVPFTHHATISQRNRASVMQDLHVTRRSKDEFDAVRRPRRHLGALLRRGMQARATRGARAWASGA